MSSVHKLCKQLGARSGLTKCWDCFGSKLFDNLMAFLRILKMLIWGEKISRGQKSRQDIPECWVNFLHAGYFFHDFDVLCRLFKSNFFKNFFKEHHQSVKRSGPWSGPTGVGPDLDPNCLHRLSADQGLQTHHCVCLQKVWLQSLKQSLINVSYHILVASLTLMALFSYHILVASQTLMALF